MELKTYPTANSWYSAMHEKGFVVPITLCQAIERLMKEKKIDFDEAYGLLEDKKSIVLKDKEFEFNPSAR